jgi:hypothetical protein
VTASRQNDQARGLPGRITDVVLDTSAMTFAVCGVPELLAVQV